MLVTLFGVRLSKDGVSPDFLRLDKPGGAIRPVIWVDLAQ